MEFEDFAAVRARPDWQNVVGNSSAIIGWESNKSLEQSPKVRL